MSPRVPMLSARKVMRALERAGFVPVRVKGSHHVLSLPDHPERFAIVPLHPGDLSRPLVLSIIKQAGLSVEEFLDLL